MFTFSILDLVVYWKREITWLVPVLYVMINLLEKILH